MKKEEKVIQFQSKFEQVNENEIVVKSKYQEIHAKLHLIDLTEYKKELTKWN